MLSSGAMTKLGYVYGNLMINVRTKNYKLAERAVTILQRAANVPRETAQQALKTAGNSVPLALIMLKTGVNRAVAQRALKAADSKVRAAIAAVKSD
jgi:N-acetylmuramic acid 6-phosphate etherase